MRARAGLLAFMMLAPSYGRAAEPVLLHAAGSLRAALTEVSSAFEGGSGTRVTGRFGASGLLRDEIAAGAKAEVFASANMEHPRALAQAGLSGPAVLFARNRLCGLARPGLDVSTGTLLDRMLDPQVKLGTSTPRADPSGDYAWAAFRKADVLRPGSYAALDGKALQLTGGPSSAPAPAGKSVYATLVERRDADLFLTYCTNARVAAAEVPGAQVVEFPEPIAVGAEYGLTVMTGSSEGAYRLALFILSPDGQGILARHGFSAPNATEGTRP